MLHANTLKNVYLMQGIWDNFIPIQAFVCLRSGAVFYYLYIYTLFVIAFTHAAAMHSNILSTH